MPNYIVAITGASGSIYADKLIRALKAAEQGINLLITDPGKLVMADELGWQWPTENGQIQTYLREQFGYLKGNSQLQYFAYNDIGAQIASGSAKNKAMIIVPCSMSTLSGIACGASNNLVQRAADVMLKEKRPLLIVPRETPLNQIHLKNMLTLAKAGAHIIPAMPAFYQKPHTIDDLANFMVGRILDILDIEHNLFKRWTGLADS